MVRRVEGISEQQFHEAVISFARERLSAALITSAMEKAFRTSWPANQAGSRHGFTMRSPRMREKSRSADHNSPTAFAMQIAWMRAS